MINIWLLYHFIIILPLKKLLQMHQVLAPVILHIIQTINSKCDFLVVHILISPPPVKKNLNGRMPIIGRLICAFNKTPSELQKSQKYFIMVTMSQANK